MVRDDVYPVRTFKVGSLLHYVIACLGLRHSAVGNRPWTSLLDIPCTSSRPMTCTSGCYYSF